MYEIGQGVNDFSLIIITYQLWTGFTLWTPNSDYTYCNNHFVFLILYFAHIFEKQTVFNLPQFCISTEISYNSLGGGGEMCALVILNTLPLIHVVCVKIKRKVHFSVLQCNHFNRILFEESGISEYE